jgi:hypothetical protein
MSGLETRNISRDSLFLLAELRLEGDETVYRVKVRNLSSGGMMAEGDVPVQRGDKVSVEMKNANKVRGSVAWVQDNRFGIAFAAEIDPKAVRTPVGNGDLDSPRFTRPSSIDPSYGRDPARLRKI